VIRDGSPSKRRGRGGPVARCPRPGPPCLSLEPGTPSIRERIDAVLHDDALFAAAGVIPVKPAGGAGRPRKYPEFVWTMWPELRGIFGTHTAVARELGRGGWWTHIRLELRRLRPELPPLPAEAPRRQDYEYMRDRYLITDDVLAASLAVHTEVAIEQAKEAGNLDPDGPGSFTHPTSAAPSTATARSSHPSTRRPAAARMPAAPRARGARAASTPMPVGMWKAATRSRSGARSSPSSAPASPKGGSSWASSTSRAMKPQPP